MNEQYIDEMKKLRKDLEKENITIEDYLLFSINKKFETILEDRRIDIVDY